MAGESVCRVENGKRVDFIKVDLRVGLGIRDRLCRVLSEFEESVRQSSARLPKLSSVVSHHHREKIASSEALRLFSTPKEHQGINSRLYHHSTSQANVTFWTVVMG